MRRAEVGATMSLASLLSGSEMTEPSGGPLTRGFLFADLRDYTAWADAHGDRAAADLLDRYRTLVREAIAGSAGAEVRTEGDSFYVVFPSASAAVGAGLAIVTAAAAASSDEPDLPIRVGIGIHAGETEERDEGPVGTAVNIAARVCAQAAAGEVLVTETVRSLTRTSGRYRFESRGRPRLKGVAEPIALYRVEAVGERAVGGTEPGGAWRAKRRAPLLVAAGLAGAVALGGLALIAQPFGSTAPASPSRSGASATSGASASLPLMPSSSVAALPAGPVAAGTYASAIFTPSVRLTFADDSWCVEREIANEIRIDPGCDQGWHQLAIFRPVIGYETCSDETTMIGQGVQDVVDYLRRHPGLASKPEIPAQLGRLDAVMVEFRVGTGCPTAKRDVPLFRDLDGPDAWDSGELATSGLVYQVLVTQVDGQVLAVWIGSPAADFAAFQAAARSLLTSLVVGR